MTKSRFQRIFEGAAGTLLTLLKIAILSRPAFGKVHIDYDKCIILGNGPSLNSFLEINQSNLVIKDFVCVNYFARTAYFEKIKPKFYIITSPEYWKGEKRKDWIEDRKKTFSSIATKTTWPMYFYVPMLAKTTKEWRKEIDGNPNIHIRYFNNTPVEGMQFFNHLFFRLKLGMPRPHNVLIPGIFLMINAGYKSIYLVGADHSWLSEIFVTRDNRVLIGQKHFYDSQTMDENTEKNKPLAKPMYIGGTTQERKLHEVLEKFYYSFRSYWELEQYAKSKKTRIVNLTKDSYIDAFEKHDPESIKKSYS